MLARIKGSSGFLEGLANHGPEWGKIGIGDWFFLQGACQAFNFGSDLRFRILTGGKGSEHCEQAESEDEFAEPG